MRQVKWRKGIKQHSIEIYDDIDQLPIERFNKANKYWMLDDNIGSSFTDIDKTHISRMILVADNKEKLLKEIENLRILIYNVISEVNPSHMAFACLVDSIDRETVTDYSEEGLRRLLKRLSDLGFSAESLKKK
jgi:hypothetical protein